MELVVLDANLDVIGVIDGFISLVWSDRFQELGDFELTTGMTQDILLTFLNGKYVVLKETDKFMVIDTVNVKTDIENGGTLIIKGLSGESILNRRIIWNPTFLDGSLQDAIATLLNENAISPTDTKRDISKLEYLASTDPIVTALTVSEFYWGDNLYDVISNLCLANGIGFKVTITTDKKFRFQLYAGTDRSYGQSTVPYVVFSPGYENLVSSDYYYSFREYKNAGLVFGEVGIGNISDTIDVESILDVSDLDRRETKIDAPDATRNTESGVISDEDYYLILLDRGYNDLILTNPKEYFDGEADTVFYKPGVDFYLGDTLQIENQYGQTGESRVFEIIFSEDANGPKTYATFGKE